jgi:hypothetical protein
MSPILHEMHWHPTRFAVAVLAIILPIVWVLAPIAKGAL